MAQRALGNRAEQEQALAEFSRLRGARESRHAAMPPPKSDVTPQPLDIRQP
jgi:hypothetical protein